MKMVKKVLLGMVALAAVFTFTSCGPKDDPEGAIKGGGNNVYTIDYTNEGTARYRAYRATSQNHAGALVTVQFDASNTNEDPSSKLGVIFNLSEKNGKKNFYCIGIAPDGKYYVSKFFNVTDIQGDNFGVADANVVNNATANDPAGTDPSEIEIVHLGSASIAKPAKVDNMYTYYIWFQGQDDGSFQWAILTGLTASEIAAYNTSTGVLPAYSTATKVNGAIAVDSSYTSNNKPRQNDVAVYAQVQPNSTLKGKWKFEGFFKEAEDIEE